MEVIGAMQYHSWSRRHLVSELLSKKIFCGDCS